MNSETYMAEARRTDTKDYQIVLERMLNPNLQGYTASDPIMQLLHGAMGISTESGELMDVVKRLLIYGKPVDFTNVKEEIGDLFWYISLVCEACSFTMADAMQANIDKLRKRYPEKFTEALALNRDVAAERTVLEAKNGWGDAL